MVQIIFQNPQIVIRNFRIRGIEIDHMGITALQTSVTQGMVEAAYDLYATRFKVLKRIIVPLVKPGLIAGSILVFIPSLGAYVTPRILGGGKHMMLGNLIGLQFGQGRNWPLGSALSLTLLMLVMLALLFYVRSIGKSQGGSHG